MHDPTEPLAWVARAEEDLAPLRRRYGGQQRGRAREMWQFHNTHFAEVAQAMGCFGIRVERPNDLHDALKQAFAADRPAVVEVLSDLKALASHSWAPPSEAHEHSH